MALSTDCPMPAKKRISLDVPAELADAFRDAATQYVHSKRQGEVLAAAIAMFLEAEPHRQAAMIKRVLNAQIDQGMAGLLRDIQARQARQVDQLNPIADASEDPPVDPTKGFGVKPLGPAAGGSGASGGTSRKEASGGSGGSGGEGSGGAKGVAS